MPLSGSLSPASTIFSAKSLRGMKRTIFPNSANAWTFVVCFHEMLPTVPAMARHMGDWRQLNVSVRAAEFRVTRNNPVRRLSRRPDDSPLLRAAGRRKILGYRKRHFAMLISFTSLSIVSRQNYVLEQAYEERTNN